MRPYKTPYTPICAHSDLTMCLCALTKHNLLATAGERDFALWRLPQIRVVARQDLCRGESTMGYVPAKGLLVLASISNGNLAAFDICTGKETDHELPSSDEAGTIAFSPNGSLVALHTDSNGGQVWEWGTKKSPVSLQGCSMTHQFAFSHDGVYVAASQGNGLTVWQAFSGQHWFTIPEAANCYCFMPDRSIAIGTGSGEVICYQYDKRYWYRDWACWVKNSVLDIAAPPAATTLAVLTEDDITVLDLKTGQRCGILCPGSESLSHLVVIPEKNLVVAADDYGTLLVWDC